jgi:hypothetical protein
MFVLYLPEDGYISAETFTFFKLDLLVYRLLLICALVFVNNGDELPNSLSLAIRTAHSDSPGISLRPFIVGVQRTFRPSPVEPFRSLKRLPVKCNLHCRSIKQTTGVTSKCLHAAKSFLCYRTALCIV